MLKKIMQKTKSILLHCCLLGIVFLSLIALLDNKNTMIIGVDTHSPYPVETEFYYTTEGIAFSDAKMSRRYKISGNNYYFRLPNLSKIQYARLDPTKKRAQHISISKNAQIIVSNWFLKKVYFVDMTKSKIGQAIVKYKVTPQGIDFRTESRDSFININMTLHFDHISNNYHFDTFLLAILIYFLLYYLYLLSKTEKMDNALLSKLILYTLFLGFSFFKVDYYKEHVHFNYPPDTIAHLSYIEYLHKHHEILPKFENMYMITNKNAGNYLGHPPLYYNLMNLVYDKNYSVTGNVEHFRTLNTILFLASILLLLYLSFNIKMSLLGHFVYLTVITSIPMHAYLGASITNDNLAILGGIIFIIGLQRLVQQNYTNLSYLLIGSGIFLAYFAKLTAGLLVFFALLFFFLYLYKNKIRIKINAYQMGILALFILPPILYQLHIMIDYHALVPTLNHTHPEEYKHSVYFIPDALRSYKSIWQWFGNYWSNIHAGWFGILSFHSLVKSSLFVYIGLFILHIFAFIALMSPCEKSMKGYCLLGKITLSSLLSVMLIQFIFSYSAHLHSGYMGGLQTRYLLPFMVSFAIMASLFVERFKTNFLFVIIIIFLSVEALYSDFFYFLKYYI